MFKIFFIPLLFTLNLQANPYASLLFHGNCTTCHFEGKTVSAPSVIEFKQRYMDAFPQKEDFIKYMSAWVQHPQKETSIMRDAIKKHALMPELGFGLDTLEIISEYIYETDFEKKHKGHK